MGWMSGSGLAMSTFGPWARFSMSLVQKLGPQVESTMLAWLTVPDPVVKQPCMLIHSHAPDVATAQPHMPARSCTPDLAAARARVLVLSGAWDYVTWPIELPTGPEI